uniref:Uncharacterized protein n=1 Tax=Timema monikensis TaxID=170555 RepID=A0A7R9E9G0_9NEOP|nr:unnamed protein product [Timema monikensis]
MRTPHCRSGSSFIWGKNETKGCTKRATPYTRGQATLFGFKRRPASANPSLAVSPSPDHSDNTTNKDSPHGGEPLPSTPRPSRPRRDAGPPANRFGFRTPSAPPATNKVSDINCNPAVTISHPTNFKNDEYKNSVNLNKERAKGGGKLVASANLNMKGSANSVVSNGSGSVGHLKNNNLVRNYIPQPTNHPNATKFTLQTSSLPRPQFPVRLTSVEADTNSKVAKTVANNTKKVSSCSAGEESSSKEGSLNGDSGVGSHQSGAGCNGETDTLHGIELLDSSPTFGYRRNRHIAPRRILGTIVKGQYFDVRDLKDDESAEDPNVITEISLISIPTTKTIQNTGLVREMSQQLRRNFPALRENNLSERSSSIATSSDESREDEGLGGEEDEEKMFRDRSNNEKSSTHKNLSPPRSIEEEDWGHGEAMAEGYTSSGDESPYSVTSSLENVQPINGQKLPRPVVLTIEDSRFAAIAASAPDLIEDERSPVDSVFSSSPPTSIASDMLSNQDAPISLPKDNQGTGSSETGVCGAGESAAQPTGTGNTLSPDSPGTPTNASNSLSLSEGRDFLIDDEIADQPGLTFDDGGVSKMGGGDMTNSSGGCSSQILSVMENSVTLVDSSHKPASKLQLSSQPEDSPLRGRRMVRAGSVDTLSPCESITSDDLMLDYECSQGSSLDCTADSRLEISNGALHDLDEETLMSELEAQGDSVLKEWSNLLGAHQG